MAVSADNAGWRLYRFGNIPKPAVKVEFKYGKQGEAWRARSEDLPREANVCELYWRPIPEQAIPPNESEVELLRRLARDMLDCLDGLNNSGSFIAVLDAAAAHGVRYHGTGWTREYAALKKALDGKP